jgi:hypothetical protein
MRLLLATNHLGLGGSESYLITVAEQLDRLGHEVALYSPEPDAGAEVAAERGIALVDAPRLDAGEYDAALVQDAGVSLQVADACPGVPQLFVAHSAKFDLQAPPQLDGTIGAVIALNDRVAARMRSFATEVEVVRLRQPIDVERFTQRAELPEVPREALLLSNAPNADRVAMLEAACAAAGLRLTRLGGRWGQVKDIRPALAAAEIVIGYGRSVLEAMACGRAAYVYDWKGGDGWVTPESYPAIEADGFAGGSCGKVFDAARLARDLGAYSASMGPVNHDLVMTNHRASVHAQELLGLIGRLAESPVRPRAPLQEMARLVRLEWRARSDVHALSHENAHLRGLLTESDKGRREAQEALRATAVELERVGEAVAQTYERSASWRLTAPLRAAGRLWRRLRGDRSQPSRSPASTGRSRSP